MLVALLFASLFSSVGSISDSDIAISSLVVGTNILVLKTDALVVNGISGGT